MKFRIQNPFRMEGNLRSERNRGEKEGEAAKDLLPPITSKQKTNDFYVAEKRENQAFFRMGMPVLSVSITL